MYLVWIQHDCALIDQSQGKMTSNPNSTFDGDGHGGKIYYTGVVLKKHCQSPPSTHANFVLAPST